MATGNAQTRSTNGCCSTVSAIDGAFSPLPSPGAVYLFKPNRRRKTDVKGIAGAVCSSLFCLRYSSMIL